MTAEGAASAALSDFTPEARHLITPKAKFFWAGTGLQAARCGKPLGFRRKYTGLRPSVDPQAVVASTRGRSRSRPARRWRTKMQTFASTV